jgi:transcriptional regulator with XRE-family HTH domain
MQQPKKTRKIHRDQEGLDKLAQQLKEVRKRLGYTQEQLSLETGISLSQIARIETGRINPTVSTLMRIARVMDIMVGELLAFKLDKLDFEK